MLGVVLWRDDQRAIVWCEDHGSLAYSMFDSGGTAQSGDGLHVGDMIRFDLEESGETRFARNPELVAEGQFSTLPQRLNDTMTSENRSPGALDGHRGLAFGLGAA